MVREADLTRRQSSSNSVDSTSPLSAGAIAGIVISVVALIVAVIILFTMYWRRQRRYRQEDEWLRSGGADAYRHQYPVGAYPAGAAPATHAGPFYTMDYKMDRMDSPQPQSPETLHSWPTQSLPGDKSIDHMASAMPTHPAYIPRALVRPSASPPAGSFTIGGIDQTVQPQPQPQAPSYAIYEPDYVKIPVMLAPSSAEKPQAEPAAQPQNTPRTPPSSKLPALVIPTQGRFTRSKRVPCREINDPGARSKSAVRASHQSAVPVRIAIPSSAQHASTSIESEPRSGVSTGHMPFRERAASLVHSVSLAGPGRERPLSINGNMMHHASDQPRGTLEHFRRRRQEDSESIGGDSDGIFG